ncbi:MAG: NADPH:quinone oxidoreductase family protein [Burkholderiales bacterium]|nr:NADPH:quinone oxidoreductase family protein [Burkholderiales bacterium]
MKAVLCKAWGAPESLVVADIPAPKAGKGQVVVAVRAAGVNFPDVLIVQGKYQVKPDLPFTPGAEVCGTVKEVGEGVTHLKPGDTVVAFPGIGGFAEEVVADAARVAPVPSELDPKLGAAVTLTYGTSYHALKDCARLAPGETLLVLGAAGGVGLAAVELGRLMGARVIAAASSAEKLEAAKRAGAEAGIDYEKEDLREAVKRLTDGKGVDVVYDPVGDRFAEPAFRSLGWHGRYLVIGFAGGEIPRMPLNLALLMERSIVGVFWGEFTRRDPKANAANMREVMQWILAGRLKPLVSAAYPLERATDALVALMNRKVLGKVVLVTG